MKIHSEIESIKKKKKKRLLYLWISDFPTSKTHRWDTTFNYGAKLNRSSTGQSFGVSKKSYRGSSKLEL